MKMVISRVESMLVVEPELRNSDKLLLMTFWEREGFRLSPQQQRAFMNCTPAESITRARRKLRKDYPAEPQIERVRFKLFRSILAFFGR